MSGEKLTAVLLSRIGVGFAVFLVAVISFVYLVKEVFSGETLKFDQQALVMINQTASSFQDTLWVIVTQFGGFVAVPIITAAIVLLLLKRKKIYSAILVVAGVGGAAIINTVLKLTFERVRPDLWEQLIVETSYSFPSGHAMASCALAATLALVTWRTRWRSLVIVGGIIYVLLVGYSRLYLGVHYPTDVFAGWAVSVAWVLFIGGIAYSYGRRKMSKPPSDRG